MLIAIILKFKCALELIELIKKDPILLSCIQSIPVVYYYGWQGRTMD